MTLSRYEHTGAAPATGLASGISSSATSFTVLSGTGYPTGSVGDFVICLDPGTSSEEKVLCSTRSGTTFTVASGGRGYDGTTAASHPAGTTNVTHVLSAAEADDANAHIYDASNGGTHAGTVTGSGLSISGSGIMPVSISDSATGGTTWSQGPGDAGLGTNQYFFALVKSGSTAGIGGGDKLCGLQLYYDGTNVQVRSTTIGGAARSTLDDGAGNATISGNLTVDGNLSVIGTSPIALLASVSYNPSTATTISTSSTSLVVLDSTNLTISFTAPSSGQVLVKLNAIATCATTGYWGLLDHTSAAVIATAAFGTANSIALSRSLLITGLTPGNTYQYDWAQATNNPSYVAAMVYGGAPPGYGPATMEVWAA